MKYKQNDIEKVVEAFMLTSKPNDRSASFDYCYNYFRTSTSKDLLINMEKSCLAIGFYLASWGMLRGSSFLLGKSAKYYEPLIIYIANQDKTLWEIDVQDYSDENIEKLITIYKDIKNILIKGNNAHLTLVTKVMLGVFGFVPAYDRFFKNTFGEVFKNRCAFTSFNKNSLLCLRDFYGSNQEILKKLSSENSTINFITGEKNILNYPRIKIIDMYGVAKG